MFIAKVKGIKLFQSYYCVFIGWGQRFIVLAVLVIALPFGWVKADTLALTLTTGDNYPPFTGLELPHGGMATSLVRKAFKASNFFVKEIEWNPWKRGYTLAERGQYHATFPYGWTAERAELFYYSDAFFPTIDYAWSLLGPENTLTQEDDLQGKVYCNPRGYADFGTIKVLMDRNLLSRETPNSMQDCFRMLQLKRVDFVVASSNTTIDTLLKIGVSLEQVQRSGFVVTEVPLHLIVSKKLPSAQQIIAAFNKGLKILWENGRYQLLTKEFKWVE